MFVTVFLRDILEFSAFSHSGCVEKARLGKALSLQRLFELQRRLFNRLTRQPKSTPVHRQCLWAWPVLEDVYGVLRACTKLAFMVDTLAFDVSGLGSLPAYLFLCELGHCSVDLVDLEHKISPAV